MGFISMQDMFRGSKKVEKHWGRLTKLKGQDLFEICQLKILTVSNSLKSYFMRFQQSCNKRLAVY